MSRISWEEYALRIAEVASQRSEDIHIQVGACVLDKEHRVVGIGYNGLAPNKTVSSAFWRDRDHRRQFMIHAEANALAMIKRGDAVLLACTLIPCSACATLIASYGIKKVVYRQPYNRDMASLKIFDFYDIECVQL
jgi:dCMP deaminase